VKEQEKGQDTGRKGIPMRQYTSRDAFKYSFQTFLQTDIFKTYKTQFNNQHSSIINAAQ